MSDHTPTPPSYASPCAPACAPQCATLPNLMTQQSPNPDTAKPHKIFAFLHWSKRSISFKLILAFGSLGLCVIMLLFWGFVLFSLQALKNETELPQKADAIVVVTGGKGRLQAAGTLFSKQLGDKLLISGVHPKFKRNNLPLNLKVSAQQMQCCIELDKRALNTKANATQTAKWAKKHGYDSLIIVTSAYHMPRTMLEMKRAAPSLTFQTYSVPYASSFSYWQRLSEPDTLKLLGKEYGKLLLAFFQLSRERLAESG
ncbi:MAG: YdcF family protein [Cohaesibacter sp.]|nr:YdcF family protein [Cohaesibacter sp.]